MEVSALISPIDEGFRNPEKLTNLDSCYHVRAAQISSWIKFKILQSKITCQVLNHRLKLSLLSKTVLSYKSQLDGSNTWNRSSDTAWYTPLLRTAFSGFTYKIEPRDALSSNLKWSAWRDWNPHNNLWKTAILITAHLLKN